MATVATPKVDNDASAAAAAEAPMSDGVVFDIAREYSDGSKVSDTKMFESAFTKILTVLPNLWSAMQKVTQFKAELAACMIEVRSSITRNGDVDYFGKSDAYRVAFTERIRPLLESAGVPSGDVGPLLEQARTNYVNRAGMLTAKIIADGIHTGAIKPPVAERFTAALVAADGKIANVPVEKIPKDVRKYVNSVAVKGKQNLPFPDAPRGSGGNKESVPDNPMETLTEALDSIVAVVNRKPGEKDAPQIHPLPSLEAIYASLTALGDICTGGLKGKAPSALAGGKDNVAAEWQKIGAYCVEVGKYLAGKESDREKSNALRFTPSDL